MIKAEEIREWENSEIYARLEELKEEGFRLRFQTGTMELENPKIFKNIRHDIARLFTVLKEREIAEEFEEPIGQSDKSNE